MSHFNVEYTIMTLILRNSSFVLDSASSGLYHLLLYVSISTRSLIGQLSWPHFTFFCLVTGTILLLLILFLGQEQVTNPQERLRGRLVSQPLLRKNEPALIPISRGGIGIAAAEFKPFPCSGRNSRQRKNSGKTVRSIYFYTMDMLRVERN